MFEPGRLDFILWANAEFPATDDDWISITENGTPVDVSGRTLTLQVRQYEGQSGSSLLTITKTSSDDLIQLKGGDPTMFRFVVRKATMETLGTAGPTNPPKMPVIQRAYDLMLDDEVYLYGLWNLRTGVTR